MEALAHESTDMLGVSEEAEREANKKMNYKEELRIQMEEQRRKKEEQKRKDM